jgi:hypothetical protein
MLLLVLKKTLSANPLTNPPKYTLSRKFIFLRIKCITLSLTTLVYDKQTQNTLLFTLSFIFKNILLVSSAIKTESSLPIKFTARTFYQEENLIDTSPLSY